MDVSPLGWGEGWEGVKCVHGLRICFESSLYHTVQMRSKIQYELSYKRDISFALYTKFRNICYKLAQGTILPRRRFI